MGKGGIQIGKPILLRGPRKRGKNILRLPFQHLKGGNILCPPSAWLKLQVTRVKTTQKLVVPAPTPQHG